MAGKSPPSEGRVRERLHPRATAKAGEVGKVVVTLINPDGIQFSDTTDFEVRCCRPWT